MLALLGYLTGILAIANHNGFLLGISIFVLYIALVVSKREKYDGENN